MIHSFYLRMINKPFFVQTVNQIVVALEGLFKAKENFEFFIASFKLVFLIKDFCLSQGVFVAFTI